MKFNFNRKINIIEFFYLVNILNILVFIQGVKVHNYNHNHNHKYKYRNDTSNLNNTIEATPIQIDTPNSNDNNTDSENNTRILTTTSTKTTTKVSIATTTSDQCEKVAAIYGCYCDEACKEYDDCCDNENYNNENAYKTNKTYDNQEELPKVLLIKTPHKLPHKKTGSCCDKNNPPVNCLCDSVCLRTNDCCPDFNKCNSNENDD